MYKIIIIIVSLITNNAVLADNAFYCDSSRASESEPIVYMGTNVHFRHTQYEKRYGHNFLRHNLPQLGIYAGLKITRSLVLEIGYEESASRKKFSIAYPEDFVAGTPIPRIFNSAVFIGKIKMMGPYIDIGTLYSLDDDGRLQLIGLAGISFLKGRAERKIICIDNFSCVSTRYLKEDKLVPRLSVGVQYMVTHHLGTRWIIGWQNTSKFRFHSSDERCAYFFPEVKPRDTIIYGVGLLWEF